MVRCWAVIERHTFRTTIFIRRSFILRRAILVFGFEFGDEKQYTVAAEVLNLFDKRYRQDDSILEPGLHANIKVGMRF